MKQIEEQLSLSGFEQVRLSEVDNLAFFRRASDRNSLSATRTVAAVTRFPAPGL